MKKSEIIQSLAKFNDCFGLRDEDGGIVDFPITEYLKGKNTDIGVIANIIKTIYPDIFILTRHFASISIMDVSEAKLTPEQAYFLGVQKSLDIMEKIMKENEDRIRPNVAEND